MMDNFKQILHEEDLEGKIIKRAIFTDEKCVMHFHNNEFCVIKPTGYDYTTVELEDSKLSFQVTESSIWRLRNYGFMADDEYKKLEEEFRIQKQEKATREELKLFEQLKAKYS